MKPDQPDNSRSGQPLLPQRPVLAAKKERPYLQTNEAAAGVIRTQIDNIYTKQETAESTAATTADSLAEPYRRHHTENPQPSTEQWQKYHTAWQEYYQKYYEGYYKHHLKLAQERNLVATQAGTLPTTEAKPIFGQNDTASTEPISAEEALHDLHTRLIGKVQQSATKVTSSRHFIPIISGLIAVIILLFLQYNTIFISNVLAYVSPGNIDAQNIIISPSTNIKVGPEPKLIIPKINVDVPVAYDIGNDYNSQMTAMASGVAHFAIPGANSHPGQIGNTVIAGHSSNDLFESGDYKFIFVQLDKLNVGDTIYANYNSVRYTYSVTKKEVVKPTDVSKLVYPTTKPILTLLTCTPIGTSTNRLLVTAEQISPDPNASLAAPTSNSTETTVIPGNSPSFIEKLFGAN